MGGPIEDLGGLGDWRGGAQLYGRVGGFGGCLVLRWGWDLGGRGGFGEVCWIWIWGWGGSSGGLAFWGFMGRGSLPHLGVLEWGQWDLGELCEIWASLEPRIELGDSGGGPR